MKTTSSSRVLLAVALATFVVLSAGHAQLTNDEASPLKACVLDNGIKHSVWIQGGKVYYQAQPDPSGSGKAHFATTQLSNWTSEPSTDCNIELTNDNCVRVTWQSRDRKWLRTGQVVRGRSPLGATVCWGPMWDMTLYHRAGAFPTAACPTSATDSLHMKRITYFDIQSVPDGQCPMLYDLDNDGRCELTFFGSPGWQIWKQADLNRFALARADTWKWPPPLDTVATNFSPKSVSDMDHDGLTDLFGEIEYQNVNDTYYAVLAILKSPSPNSYPDSLVFYQRFAHLIGMDLPFYSGLDLDGQGPRDMFFQDGDSTIMQVYKCMGDGKYDCVWRHYDKNEGGSFVFGDFDGSGHQGFVSCNDMIVFAYKNVSPDSYVRVWLGDTFSLPGGNDVFADSNFNGTGRPKFFISFGENLGLNWKFWLTGWTPNGDGSYRRTIIDTAITPMPSTTVSCCGDLDGDGRDEICWATPYCMRVYRVDTSGYSQVWSWDDSLHNEYCSGVYDVNHDGYNELVVLGRYHLSIFEVEAVRVLAPNGGESLHPGESENLHWQTFNPPRCDSLSLFYSVDNGQTYEPIATGLPGTDTSYLWTVPNVISDSCRIKIMAYGPGHQYDESDSCFSILATGIAGKSIQPIYETRLLGVFPNPTTSHSLIRFEVSKPEQVNLRLRDVSGRLVATLADGVLQPGHYSLPLDFSGLGTRSRFAANRVKSPGVYFLTLDASDRHETRKLIIAQ